MKDLSENRRVHVRLLLGAAGTGKTFRCLEEIRAELKCSPEGPPLLFLAPKQATFQIERQLLADENIHGFTRLHVLSFERLASFALVALDCPEPRLLNDQGQIMVLRALLARHSERLKLFRASARLPGFAQQLSTLLRELQQAQVTPGDLESEAARLGDSPLAGKLADAALMFRQYRAWLEEEKIEDAERLLDIATEALNAAAGVGLSPCFGGLWLDGFAEMTRQELALLRAVVPWCARATLAFCCEADTRDAAHGFSAWSLVADTAQRCANALDPQRVTTEPMPREPGRNRFDANPELAHLERNWAGPVPFQWEVPLQSVRVIRCATPEAEATFAAREILRHVRAGGRFRDIAVVVRKLDGYQNVLRRVFNRYEIPFFLDCREPVAHHPLAELTRYAVRCVAFGWAQEDWFGLLKSGLIGVPDVEVDWLENEALARGWKGSTWLEPLQIPEDRALAERLEALRAAAIRPMRDFQAVVSAGGSYQPTGKEFADALYQLWRAFDVGAQLTRWATESDKTAHATVWEQMQQWLEMIELGFAHQRLGLREWLPIVEAGLAGLSVGIIPPAIDQVLVGSIDRSRNPDLHTAFVLGVNEGVFPAPPLEPVLLNETERAQLAGKLWLGASTRQQLAHERFYGYIACTRAHTRLFVTFSDTDRIGRKRNPSAFIAHLQRLFPGLSIENIGDLNEVTEIVHPCEMIAGLWRAQAAGDERASVLLNAPAFAALGGTCAQAANTAGARLSPGIVERLYPARLVTSVSRLEEFASCRFKFFVRVGLRAQERIRYEVDARHTGIFQHEVLKAFHCEVKERFGGWRKIAPAQARTLVREIAERERPRFRNGVLVANQRDRVESANLVSALEDFIETIVGWMAQYRFEPCAVELSFGEKGPLPSWELELGNGRRLAFTGTIDRVDLLVEPSTRTARAVVIDYKSSARTVDAKLLAGGVQLQLFAYLAALRKLREAAKMFDAERLVPAGAFYVTLRGSYDLAGSRDEALADVAEARRDAYRHRGRFIGDLMEVLDSEAAKRGRGNQFAFRVTKKGFHEGDRDPVSAQQFDQLLAGVEGQLVAMGRSIFEGDVSINPYRHGNKTPCDHCDYGSICRIDRWTHEFRALGNGEGP